MKIITVGILVIGGLLGVMEVTNHIVNNSPFPVCYPCPKPKK